MRFHDRFLMVVARPYSEFSFPTRPTRVLGEWLKLPPCSPRHTIHLIHAFRTGTRLVVAGLGKVPPELGGCVMPTALLG